MIRSLIQNAVFVLGAGASCPYGFPTGKELRKQIIARHVVDCEAHLKANSRARTIVSRELRLAKEFVEKFRKSSTESVDLFLSRNPEFSRVGKRAIIFRILDAEYYSIFREKAHEGQDWYKWLYKQMTDILIQKKDYSYFSNNDVSVITFNYDRSLEHFLYDSLSNSFNGIPEDKIIEQLNQIKMCHVFGKVGPLEWQSQNGGIKYRANANDTDVDALCDNIKIVYEDRENPKLEEVHELIRKANRIFFLGFGYAEENLNAIRIPEVLKDVGHVYGTAMGFTHREITKFTPILQAKIEGNERSATIKTNMDCLALLREYL